MPLIRRIIHSRYFVPSAAALLYLVLRFILIFVFHFSGNLLNDDGFSEYWTTASQFYDDGLEAFGADPYVEPGYPILIWLGRLISNNLVGVFILQSLVSAAGCFYFCLLARHLSAKKSVEIIAALLYVFSPYALRISIKISEVPLFRTLLVMSVYYFVNGIHRARPKVLSGFFLDFRFWFAR